jgi:hypothetical protein
MLEASKLYRPCQPAEVRPRFVTSADFLASLSMDLPCVRPPQPCRPRGEWHCWNPDCGVNEVRIQLTSADPIHDPSELPGMHCPACGDPLAFRHYLEEQILEPVAREDRTTSPALPESDEDSEISQLVEFIRRQGGRISPRALQRSNSRKYPRAEHAEAALASLADAGLGDWQEGPARLTGGHRGRFLVLRHTETEGDKTMNQTSTTSLPRPPVTPPAWSGWFRTGTRGRWRLFVRHDDQARCEQLLLDGAPRGSDKLVRPTANGDPNEDRPA